MNEAILELLGQIATSYEDEAPECEKYPYMVFEIHCISNDEAVTSYSMEVNIWDKRETYKRAALLSKKLKALNGTVLRYENGICTIYYENDKKIRDSDEEIKRIQSNFLIREAKGE